MRSSEGEICLKCSDSLRTGYGQLGYYRHTAIAHRYIFENVAAIGNQ